MWWSLSGALIESGAEATWISGWPNWIYLVIPSSVGIFAARFPACWTGSRIYGLRWTLADLFRLSAWRSLSSTVPLLIFAAGIDDLYARDLFGILWIGFAGILVREGVIYLRIAEGFKPRLIKSGELFKRSFVMAKQMCVELKGVFAYPAGKGQFMNAVSAPGFIGMSDVCIHRLRGSQLDYVIGHELAHIQQKHTRNKLRIVALIYLGIATLTLGVPHLSIFWRVVFKFCVILIPLLVFYSVSRRFEFAADRVAVELTGEGENAMRALATLYYRSGVPAMSNSFDELFLTHPSLWKRMSAIAGVGHVPYESVTGILREFNDRAGEFSGPDS